MHIIQLQVAVKKLYDEYISPTAPRCINVDDRIQKAVESKLSNPPLNIFHEAQEHVGGVSAPFFLSSSPTPLLLSPSLSSLLLSLSPCPSHSSAVAVLFSLYPLPLLPLLYPPYSLHFPSILLGQLSIWVSKEMKSTCHLLWIFITVV